jgi:hypothetical protein
MKRNMLQTPITLLFATACMSLASAPTVQAGPVTSNVATEAWTPFAKGNTELELLGGAYGGLSSTDTPKRPDFGFALGSLRYGWMLNDPSGDGLLRGNWEFLLGAFGGPVFEGPGSYHFGADLNLRYNFVQPGATVIPFFQISAGGDYSDVSSDDAVQDYLGTEWNYALGATLGVRWMLSERMAMVTTFDYRHFSNAGSSDRNRGYNGLGGSIGLSWFY